jgi:hypothetical protein
MYDPNDTTPALHNYPETVAAGEHPLGGGICRDVPYSDGPAPVCDGDWGDAYQAMGLAMTPEQHRAWVERMGK